MSLNLAATPAIKRAVVHINELDISKFPLLLTRILSKLHLKDERTFSEEEEEKLQSSLSLSDTDLELVIHTLEFILHQAAYHTAKPGILGQQLQQLELEEEKVKVIVDAWKNTAADVVSKLRQRSITPKRLEEINWRLNLQMAQSSKAKMKLPNAMFELGISDENSENKEKIHFEMTHDELYSFYSQLETIQKQLDGLG
ncbi:COMM domain-containing protein 10-like [Saccostrea echinata]|uniref:COMM domain-containing protein 10-like n=1 Tax=Saccostrea echinata TaxID=191078 RepID=UPI002A8147FA|nr:COMM domain-containing protein 10-like [Saccostrea echinata]XP_061172958.1 COMM domain-containing protein 10-like [Saccostrea echinata]